MAEDIESDFKQIKISRLTLGLIMSVAVTSGVIVWNAAQVAGRISELEQTVNRVEADMGDLNFETDPAILIRLGDLEEKIDELAEIFTTGPMRSKKPYEVAPGVTKYSENFLVGNGTPVGLRLR
jgi:hypothetical protein